MFEPLPTAEEARALRNPPPTVEEIAEGERLLDHAMLTEVSSAVRSTAKYSNHASFMFRLRPGVVKALEAAGYKIVNGDWSSAVSWKP